jgi:hypothetical protein
MTEPDRVESRIKKIPSLHSSLEGFYVFHGHNGKKGQTVRGFEAIPEIKRSKKLTKEFYETVLGVDLADTVDSPLIGRIYCHEWIAADNTVLVVYGTITGCEQCFSTEVPTFIVEFNETSRATANDALAELGISVPHQKRLSEEIAWGGCLLHESRLNCYAMDLPSMHSLEAPRGTIRWAVPTSTVQHNTLANGAGGVLTATGGDPNSYPCRSLVFRGYSIVLQVRQSLIPNAGLGTFVSCTPLFDLPGRPDFFELRLGEILDLGVYAPLQASDKKPDHTVMLKNFLLSWKPESWNFDPDPDSRGRYVFDFTEDTTGELQNWSMNSVLPFVNETDGRETATVHAKYDPSGSVQ